MAPLKLTGQAMRRNESLCEMGRDRPECAGIRANKSAASLVEEAQQQHRSQQQRASRSLLLEACALHLEKLIEPAPGSQQPSQQQQPQQSSSSQPYRRCAFPTDAAVLNYIGTIASRLSLPNSCVIAMVIYVERLASAPYFTLTACNWQPSIVAAFVVAAKLFLDEQVWNEVGRVSTLHIATQRCHSHALRLGRQDFLRVLQKPERRRVGDPAFVAQISHWEACICPSSATPRRSLENRVDRLPANGIRRRPSSS